MANFDLGFRRLRISGDGYHPPSQPKPCYLPQTIPIQSVHTGTIRLPTMNWAATTKGHEAHSTKLASEGSWFGAKIARQMRSDLARLHSKARPREMGEVRW